MRSLGSRPPQPRASGSGPPLPPALPGSAPQQPGPSLPSQGAWYPAPPSTVARRPLPRVTTHMATENTPSSSLPAHFHVFGPRAASALCKCFGRFLSHGLGIAQRALSTREATKRTRLRTQRGTKPAAKGRGDPPPGTGQPCSGLTQDPVSSSQTPQTTGGRPHATKPDAPQVHGGAGGANGSCLEPLSEEGVSAAEMEKHQTPSRVVTPRGHSGQQEEGCAGSARTSCPSLALRPAHISFLGTPTPGPRLWRRTCLQVRLRAGRWAGSHSPLGSGIPALWGSALTFGLVPRVPIPLLRAIRRVPLHPRLGVASERGAEVACVPGGQAWRAHTPVPTAPLAAGRVSLQPPS